MIDISEIQNEGGSLLDRVCATYKLVRRDGESDRDLLMRFSALRFHDDEEVRTEAHQIMVDLLKEDLE